MKSVKYIAVFVLTLGIVTVVATNQVFAHVIVKPAEVTTGSYPTFTMNVPNEKDIPVTGLRLIVPGNMQYVTPTVKQGWSIETKKSGDTVTEISWAGGSIAAGLRDEFTFSAQTPNKASELDWKAYQTYEDGSVVSWDQKPTNDHGHQTEDESKGPFSITNVSVKARDDVEAISNNNSSDKLALIFGGVAIVLSVAALARASKK